MTGTAQPTSPELARLLDWFGDPRPPVARQPPAGGPGAVADRVLDALLSSAHRKGSLESMDVAAFRGAHRDRVARRVGRGDPVQVTLMAFPFKVPNPLKVGARRDPDLAELGAIRQLLRLDETIRAVHPPGLQIIVIHDGDYLASVFGVNRTEVRAYTRYFTRLLEATGAASVIRPVELRELVRRAGPRVTRADCRALWQASAEWLADPGCAEERAVALRRTLGMLATRTLPIDTVARLFEALAVGMAPPAVATRAGLGERLRLAARRYWMRDQILRRFDPRVSLYPEGIHATTQSRPGRLALWLVERGRSRLPWHGVGVLRQDGRVRVAWARDVAGVLRYRPVHLAGEATPFYHEENC